MKNGLTGIVVLLVVCFNIQGQTIITQPNPILRYETRYTQLDLNLKKIDTLLDDFHRFHPTDRWETPYLAANLGNAPRPLLFDPKISIGFSDGYRLMQPYFWNVDSVKFYDTKTPFTSAEYDFGAKEENFIKLTHSQNINPFLNMAIDYSRPVSQGFYNHQKSGIHNFSFSQWYHSPSKRYNLISAYLFNQSKIEENGGVSVSDIFSNPAYAQDKATAPTFLDDAQNKINNNRIFLCQTIYLGPKKRINDSTGKFQIQPKYGITHLIAYHSKKINYQDEEDSSSQFYTQFYISGQETHDYTKVSSLTNEISFHNYAFQSIDSTHDAFKNAWKGGIRYIFNKYRQNTWTENRQDLQLFGSIKSVTSAPSKWSYAVQAEVDLAPKYIGDYWVKGHISYQPNPFLSILPYVELNTQSPSMKVERVVTNHAQWTNDFKKMSIFHPGIQLGLPHWKLFFTADYFLVKNYIFYNELAQPAQEGRPLHVLKLTAEKNFYLKNFVFKNQAVYQMVNLSDIIHQPQFYIKTQWYYRGSYIKKKPLHAQLGIDVTYFGNHYADRYMPSIMEYYIQNSHKLKYLPIVDAFFNLQVKRTRIFLVYQHVTQGLFGQKGYYVYPDSPASLRALRLGVSWQFYD